MDALTTSAGRGTLAPNHGSMKLPDLTRRQSTARQDLALHEADIKDPVVFEEDPGTSSRLHPLQRPEFRAIDAARALVIQA
ncbi:hypothetical protein ACFWBN_24260 [Streptomyces sp. NPDC059989]|uniref:hypothetical protein n=1 Tax=Streptomyces sp. NPDC059989 TaxID=3347026 RepID=UPI0036A473C9